MVHPTLKKGVISSYFGNRASGFHPGIDIVQGLGSPIYAAFAGVVTIASVYGGYGNLVEITSNNGIKTRYAHLSRILVNKGQSVRAGQKIGLEGSTGYSTGSHLHFEIIKNNVAIDPLPYLKTATLKENNNNTNIILLAIGIYFLYENKII